MVTAKAFWRALSVGVVFGSLATSPAAVADGKKTEFSRSVEYGDLDLSVASDGAVLLARLEGAARRVCDDATPRTQLKPHAVADCTNQTVEGLVRQLDIKTLTLAWSDRRSVAE